VQNRTCMNRESSCKVHKNDILFEAHSNPMGPFGRSRHIYIYVCMYVVPNAPGKALGGWSEELIYQEPAVGSCQPSMQKPKSVCIEQAVNSTSTRNSSTCPEHLISATRPNESLQKPTKTICIFSVASSGTLQ
jgi:hypothetical protein